MVGSGKRMRAVRGLPRRVGLAIVGLLLSFAILSGFARANGRYFYCEAMGMMATDPCAAAAAHRGERTDGPSTEARPGHSDCCEIVTLPSLPQGTTTASSAVPSPALVALIPGAPLADLLLGRARAHPDRARERWRPLRRSAAQARAQLMVFLT